MPRREDIFYNRLPSTVEETLAYCLKQLYADRQHAITEEFIHGLTYEELIGTLLQARDMCDELKKREEEECTSALTSAGVSQF